MTTPMQMGADPRPEPTPTETRQQEAEAPRAARRDAAAGPAPQQMGVTLLRDWASI